MSHLELRAQMTVRPGQLEGFKAQAAEIMRLTRELDTHTLRYDWFISEDGTRCEVHEEYASEQGLFEHNEHVMAARATFFRAFADGHHMTAYGEVSQRLVDLSKFHAGGLERYAFLSGLEPGVMDSQLELHAQLRIRPGQLETFKAQAAEIVRLARERDTQTARFDWFISEDGTLCEIHETYASGAAFFEHTQHIMEARGELFRTSVDGHHVTAYGDVPQSLSDLANAHAGGLERYAFLQGLQPEPAEGAR
ncbi:MAG TPA: antibiotic biosynthesis monooxygenase [Intrasporangium sp.]|nr:antibiotic biosynthesis monooxygenase [Intrasporangium sp.]